MTLKTLIDSVGVVIEQDAAAPTISLGANGDPDTCTYTDRVFYVEGASVVDAPTVATRPFASWRWNGSVLEANPDWEAPPVPSPWDDLKAIPSDEFIALVAKAITPPRWARLRSDPMAQWIWDVVMAPTMTRIDPNDTDGNFRGMLGYLKSTNGQDSEVLMSEAEESAIRTAWRVKSATD